MGVFIRYLAPCITIEIPDEYLMKMTGIAASISVKIFCNSERFHVEEVLAHDRPTKVHEGEGGKEVGPCANPDTG